MLLKHYLEQGTSKSALARQLGVSRDTIHRWIRAGDLDRDLDATPLRYGPRPAVATKLEAYKPIIEARLAVYPELSAVRLLEEIRAAGYGGGYAQLKAFVRVCPTAAGSRTGHPLRDARWPTGAGRRRAFPLSVGRAVRAARGARVLPVALVPVLSAAGHADD